jgi:hypothetical protein
MCGYGFVSFNQQSEGSIMSFATALLAAVPDHPAFPAQSLLASWLPFASFSLASQPKRPASCCHVRALPKLLV